MRHSLLRRNDTRREFQTFYEFIINMIHLQKHEQDDRRVARLRSSSLGLRLKASTLQADPTSRGRKGTIFSRNP